MDRTLADIAVEAGIPPQRVRDYIRHGIDRVIKSRLLFDDRGRRLNYQNPQHPQEITVGAITARNGWESYVPQKDMPAELADKRRRQWREQQQRRRARLMQRKGLTTGSACGSVEPHLTGGTALNEQAADNDGDSTTDPV